MLECSRADLDSRELVLRFVTYSIVSYFTLRKECDDACENRYFVFEFGFCWRRILFLVRHSNPVEAVPAPAKYHADDKANHRSKRDRDRRTMSSRGPTEDR